VAARPVFRRRSISENTYHRFSHLHPNVAAEASGIASAGETLTTDPSKRVVRVVCSNDDLKAIVHQHKRSYSPTEIATSFQVLYLLEVTTT